MISPRYFINRLILLINGLSVFILGVDAAGMNQTNILRTDQTNELESNGELVGINSNQVATNEKIAVHEEEESETDKLMEAGIDSVLQLQNQYQNILNPWNILLNPYNMKFLIKYQGSLEEGFWVGLTKEFE